MPHVFHDSAYLAFNAANAPPNSLSNFARLAEFWFEDSKDDRS